MSAEEEIPAAYGGAPLNIRIADYDHEAWLTFEGPTVQGRIRHLCRLDWAGAQRLIEMLKLVKP